MLNRMNVLREISDYQVAAKLIHLPAAIFTDSFVYINPGAYMAYGAQKEIDGDVDNMIIQYLNDDLLQSIHPAESLVENLSHIQCFTILDGETQHKCLISAVMLYEFHSEELEFMNQTEFGCLIHSAKSVKRRNQVRTCSLRFYQQVDLDHPEHCFFQQSNEFQYLQDLYHHILEQSQYNMVQHF